MFGKKKLEFDSESLSLKRPKFSWSKFFLKFIPLATTSLIISAVFIFVFYYFYDSPEEIILKRENELYKEQLALFSSKLDKIDKILKDLEYRDNNIYRTIFEAEPIPSTIRESGTGGANKYEKLEGYKYSGLVIDIAKKLDKIEKEVYVQSKSYDEIVSMAKRKEDILRHIPAIQPILNKQLRRISSYFGYRIDPVYKIRKHHDGIDFTAPIGTPVHATGDGIVTLVKHSNRGYGNQIEISHGYSYKTKYAHLSKILVKEGDHVKRGQVIGLVGNTGKSVGQHLHYEVRKNNVPINPINFFFQDMSPEEYDRMIELSAQPGGQSLD
jgi:murein DD-endopeptidase MepM/ murein hydrolase activator NlpD